jgi:hypothetical protein
LVEAANEFVLAGITEMGRLYPSPWRIPSTKTFTSKFPAEAPKRRVNPSESDEVPDGRIAEAPPIKLLPEQPVMLF